MTIRYTVTSHTQLSVQHVPPRAFYWVHNSQNNHLAQIVQSSPSLLSPLKSKGLRASVRLTHKKQYVLFSYGSYQYVCVHVQHKAGISLPGILKSKQECNRSRQNKSKCVVS